MRGFPLPLRFLRSVARLRCRRWRDPRAPGSRVGSAAHMLARLALARLARRALQRPSAHAWAGRQPGQRARHGLAPRWRQHQAAAERRQVSLGLQSTAVAKSIRHHRPGAWAGCPVAIEREIELICIMNRRRFRVGFRAVARRACTSVHKWADLSSLARPVRAAAISVRPCGLPS